MMSMSMSMPTSYVAIFTIAILGSFSHCIGMCGGFVLSYTSVKIDSSWSKKYQALMHLLYGIGRTTSYVVLGVIFGFIGQNIGVNLFSKGILFILLGVLMFILGISFIDKIGINKYLKLDILEIPIIKSIHFKTFKSKKAYSFFIFGVLNGFIPCGLVYFFLSTSIISSSAQSGAIGMLIFGLSTIPALFIVGFMANIIKNKFVKIFNYVASFLIISYGTITILKGFMMVLK
ncbi:Heavy-metal-associated domain (N-terminus) and membrane-bounded cytochrome biogenesis cycZ-like domain, possible membrane copper tolerance protein [hydrothermal vent metagenome]|uniref:Heavy-metal-associated domain (N-terminus) and membrane-bounded cytochrome biogenesis cycZ-like domain, possible membrane copper tolerance protein n=1 Tax=hydrothermal vent metagenome TaxID=652676 RepID=A0A3B1DYQ5_9ZZZZ